jgi:uncharacterized protein YbaR (Trm112 family)
MSLDENLLEILACPKCKHAIEVNDQETAVICSSCRLSFPVRNGIPVMLLDESRPCE